MALLLGAVLSGCSSGPAPESAAPPASHVLRPDPETGFTRIISGAGDSVGTIPGSASAEYVYRFRQITPPSDRFTFRDRELTFSFRPTPEALHMQVENQTEKPIWIEWDRSSFMDPLGSRENIAHNGTRFQDRYGTQPDTQIPGFSRYSDYMFPVTYLVDPAGSNEQLHRPLLPEDSQALHFSDAVFGVDLVFRLDQETRPYTFRFKVRSVLSID